MANVSLQNITKVYEPAHRRENPVTAVDDVSLDVRDGEFLVLVGPSGCGKSTTLRMIAGLESITRGTLKIADRHVNNVPPKDRDIAMVFQNYALYPHMSVFDNMAFGLKLRKFSKEEIETRVNEAAEILGIAELLERKPRALSGGQRQRVALGRAIVRKPAVFLFDEPLSNLDAKMRVQMRTEISRLHKRLRATMIYVTHDQVEAMTMGDRIAVMKDGVVQQVDTPLNLYNQPVNAFVAGFLGSPPMNLIPGTARRDGSAALFTEANGPLTLDVSSQLPPDLNLNPQRQLLLGIRPEDIVHLQENSPEIPQTQLLQATLELAEPLGAETNLYVSTGTHPLVCRRPGVLASLEEGRQILLRIDPRKIQLFDAQSGERLTQTANS